MKFKAHLEQLPKMIDFIRLEAKNKDVDPERIRKLELASEEALVNIISYAYIGSQQGFIEVDCQKVLKHIEITFRDTGVAFNPIESPVNVQKNVPIDERPIGGLGIYLMRQLMDEVSYRREGDQNILTIKMNL